MVNKIDQHAAMHDLEVILKKLSRQGLRDYLSQSCQQDMSSPEWDTADRQKFIDLALQLEYGTEAFQSYRKEFPA